MTDGKAAVTADERTDGHGRSRGPRRRKNALGQPQQLGSDRRIDAPAELGRSVETPWTGDTREARGVDERYRDVVEVVTLELTLQRREEPFREEPAHPGDQPACRATASEIAEQVCRPVGHDRARRAGCGGFDEQMRRLECRQLDLVDDAHRMFTTGEPRS